MGMDRGDQSDVCGGPALGQAPSSPSVFLFSGETFSELDPYQCGHHRECLYLCGLFPAGLCFAARTDPSAGVLGTLGWQCQCTSSHRSKGDDHGTPRPCQCKEFSDCLGSESLRSGEADRIHTEELSGKSSACKGCFKKFVKGSRASPMKALPFLSCGFR